MSSQSQGIRSGPRLRPERLWLVLAVTWVTAITLAPFYLSFVPNELSVRIQAAFQIEPQGAVKDAGHIASFFIIGILLAANLSRLRKRWFIFLAIIVLGCVALESAQLFESGRHARLTDVVLNVIIPLLVGAYARNWALHECTGQLPKSPC